MDDLERRIREARPISGHRDLPLSDRAKRELAELLLVDVPEESEQRGSARTFWRRPLVWAAVVVITIIAVASAAAVLQPTHAFAATPPLLTTEPVAGTAADLLNQIAGAAAATGDPTPTGDIHIGLQEWALNMEYDTKIVSTTVVPQEYSIDRHADGSWTIVVTAGPALKYADSAAGSGDTPPEGTVLWSDHYRPGDYEPLFPIPFPTVATQVGPYFERLFDPGTILDADAAFQNIPQVLREQVFGGVQRAAALHYLAGLPGIGVVGAVTDRLGRPGIMFRTDRTGDPNYLDYLVIDPNNGKILAAETHYVGHDRTDIRSPSVTSYAAWK